MEEVDLSLKLGVFSGPFGVFNGPLRNRSKGLRTQVYSLNLLLTGL
ncbi:hypothetical protein SLEP1_g2255 [Rubroshorea leprosula]|uniref:Uncharacterized protein n=1 Tax=Rubroshorea leprosula TaxID=152421 RepID=A0AAV5HQ99_9ROSI|nr:hypothetical protein SLEP1_g2255 [Rubroshorea leprosula]